MDIRRPPIWECGVAALVLVVVSVVYLASYLPDKPNTLPAYVMLAAATLLVVVQLVLLIPTLVTMTLASGFQIAHNFGFLDSSYPRHGWIVASFIVVGIMAVIAIGYLEPANIAVLFELKKPQPDGELIAKLMKRFLYTAGITGAAQVATLVIMTRLAS